MYKWTVFFLALFSLSVSGQELKCTVQVSYERITDANPQIFKTLEKSLGEFMNNTRWTNKDFAKNERIECSFFINISAYDSNQFTATLQVQASRPIYNSTYMSPIFNFSDQDFGFTYTEYQNLYFNPNSFDSNLISVVAFYANVIIGLDADSYQNGGGLEYLEAAQNIAVLAQQSGYKGWEQSQNNRNRYTMINDMLSNTYAPFRECMYEYHFLAMDRMSENQKEAKQKVADAIKTIAKIQSVRPNAFLTRIFFDAKADELVSIFSGGPNIPVNELVETLNRISPLNSSKWSNIR